jgi:Universal stress protein family
VRLAHALNIEVHVAHVADRGESHDGLSARARYADAIHHEYPSQFAELVSRVVPECAPEECRHICDIALCHGDVVDELRTLIERKQISLIVAGWHGKLMSGRACALTQLIQTVSIPILLVKPGRRTGLKLKVGEELE